MMTTMETDLISPPRAGIDQELADTVIVASGLTFAYPGGRDSVLTDVDLVVVAGRMTAITGPSGSGKSTLMHCLAGLLPTTSGEVQVLGHHVNQMKEPERTVFRRDHLGFVFQQPGLLDDLTAVDNAAIAGWVAGRSRRTSTRRARGLLEDVGLAEFANRLPGELSGGQAQRVGIARALMNDPSVVFADEPTGALDRASGRRVMALLRRVADRGAAVVLVTHDRQLASEADHQVALADGRVVGRR